MALAANGAPWALVMWSAEIRHRQRDLDLVILLNGTLPFFFLDPCNAWIIRSTLQGKEAIGTC